MKLAVILGGIIYIFQMSRLLPYRQFSSSFDPSVAVKSNEYDEGNLGTPLEESSCSEVTERLEKALGALERRLDDQEEVILSAISDLFATHRNVNSSREWAGYDKASQWSTWQSFVYAFFLMSLFTSVAMAIPQMVRIGDLEIQGERIEDDGEPLQVQSEGLRAFSGSVADVRRQATEVDPASIPLPPSPLQPPPPLNIPLFSFPPSPVDPASIPLPPSPPPSTALVPVPRPKKRSGTYRNSKKDKRRRK